MPELRLGVVSVVLVNFRGAEDTNNAVEQLKRVDWPPELLEIVVVDNASDDGSVASIRDAHPDIVLVESKENRGFAGGCNLGVSKSSGEFLGFLNNDARPDTGWIREAVNTFAESSRIGAVASKVLDWEGELIDYVGSGLTWFGMGYKPGTAEPFRGQGDRPTDVLFGTGSAMFVRRSVFEQLDGFDERYFMFFEDVDLGWRLNLRGWRFRFQPASLAFHQHHASMSSFGAYKETYLLERNALFTLFKNLEQGTLDRTLPAALSLAVRRSVARGGFDSRSFDLRRHDNDHEETAPVSKDAIATVFGIDQFVEELPKLKESRDAIQSSRVVSDARLRKMFGFTDAPSYQIPYYLDGYEKVVETFDVADPDDPTKVLIITGDPIGAKMAGPAIRAWNMALALSRENDVSLVSLSGAAEVIAPFGINAIRPSDQRAFARYEEWADVIIFQGHAMAIFDALRTTKKIVVVDVYDPMHLEQLEQARELGRGAWEKQVSDATAVMNEQLERGDFFLCASERQKHMYVGQLAALGRINPSNYADDPDLERLIAVVPFGLEERIPQHTRDVLRGVVPGIERDDKVLLWSGGLYNWFDPATLIRAVAKLSETRPSVRLFFQGTKHPHPGVPEMAVVPESRSLAQRLGVLDKSVFFNDSWVDFDDRESFLREANAGVSTHRAHVETTFSFRTRILDYLWAGLPMVVTEGDSFAELIAKEHLGVVVKSGDVDDLVSGLERILFDDEFIAEARQNIDRVRGRFAWAKTLEPVIDFVAAPQHAQDLVDRGVISLTSEVRQRRGRPKTHHGLRGDIGIFFNHLLDGGPIHVARKARDRITRNRRHKRR